MFRHISLLTFSSESTRADHEAARDALLGLPALIPELRAYTVGIDVGINEGNATLGVVADFDSVDDYRVYARQPDHLRIIAELIRPFLTLRTAIQHDL